ncbi:MAG: hypothetical protein Cpurp_09245 [Chlorogloea purpurea SAG 13.99]|nr:hypothetical protein [Chlorogloea purpurea SAG 13.99]
MSKRVGFRLTQVESIGLVQKHTNAAAENIFILAAIMPTWQSQEFDTPEIAAPIPLAAKLRTWGESLGE